MSTKRTPVSNPVETEAKIQVRSFVATKRKLAAAGASLRSERAREINTLFDDPKGALRLSGKSFRVRRYGLGGAVTLKGAARVEGGLKSRMELETEVASPERLTQILISLGFVPVFRYEKFREVWDLGKTVICLDQTPLGRFVEIEGEKAWILETAERLGFSPDQFLSTSYPALWFEAGRRGDMLFADATRPLAKRSAVLSRRSRS